MHFQWFPGHMTKAIRSMTEDIRLVDLIIELADARIPYSSRNPEIDSLAGGKKRILLLNKRDMADPEETKRWINSYEEQNIPALAINAKNRNEIKNVIQCISDICREKKERDLKRGIKNRPVRAMIVGIPNVGKSTFINTFAGRASAKTGNRPGVTKGKQWIRTKGSESIELLDTPGILWPKFENQTVGLHLVWIGSIRDEIIESVDPALDLIEFLQAGHTGILERTYGISPDSDSVECLRRIAKARGCLTRGGDIDLARAAFLLLDDFRNARLGAITIEKRGFPNNE